jgi:hypothetical protein
MRCGIILNVAACTALAFAASSRGETGHAAWHATDLEGHPVSQLVAGNTHVVVLIFAATDCPVSKRYIPEIQRIERQFTQLGVAFWWVFPNPGDSAAIVRKHELDYSIHAQTLIDTRQELVHMAHVSVTPEAAVFSVAKTDATGLREVYHGRIDDRYLSLGRARTQADTHELEDAVTAVLGGHSPRAANARAIGCSIVPLNMRP